MLEPRRAVQNLQPYSPPLADRRGLRLDFNESTAGCSPRVLARLRTLTAEDLARYPERAPVEAVVARYLEVAPEQVLLTNGVDEAIHLLSLAYVAAGDEVLIPTPTFAMYELNAHVAGANVVAVRSGEDFAFPTEQLLRGISPRTRLIAIANPNNPTGAVASIADLLRVAQAAPHAAVLIDEAYFEFYGVSMLAELSRAPNLFIARTFSKAYGLAGLRAGVLVGDSRQIALVRRVASPYSVNAAALACLPEALRDQQYVRAYVAEVRAGRARLEPELSALGVRYWPSEANFVLVAIGERHREFVDAMRRRGVLVRDRSRDPGCAGCVRVTLGGAAETAQMLTALRAALKDIAFVREAQA